MTEDLTEEELRAIVSLKRRAKSWPASLWLFSADGTLHVMRKAPDGGTVADVRYSIATIDIENDGGDWCDMLALAYTEIRSNNATLFDLAREHMDPADPRRPKHRLIDQRPADLAAQREARIRADEREKTLREARDAISTAFSHDEDVSAQDVIDRLLANKAEVAV